LLFGFPVKCDACNAVGGQLNGSQSLFLGDKLEEFSQERLVEDGSEVVLRGLPKFDFGL
jgi:hypothetical protein